MTSTIDDVRTHPVHDFAERVNTRLDHVLSAESRPVWAMTPAEQRDTLLALDQLQNKLDGLRLQVLAEADRTDACTSEGDRTAADWIARHTRQRRPHARADLHLAKALDSRYTHTATAMTLGRVNTDQARVITRALDELPTTGEDAITSDQLVSAEAHLVDAARHHDATDLAVMGRRLFEVIAPDEADAREGRALERQEREARRRVSFTMREDDQGVCHGRFRIPTLHGAMLGKALAAIMSPARPTAPDGGETADLSVEQVDNAPPAHARPYATRRGEAFTELIETLAARDLPAAGGGDATVVVTTTLADLEHRLDRAGVATLDTGHRISAAEARRLACHHKLIPAILGGRSEVLDLGRSRRLHSKAQRLAMSLRDGGCTAAHCDTPAAMCHAHHDTPWSQGGPTDLDNGRLLCGHHHHRIHDPAYHHTLTSDARVRFHRRE